MTDPAQPAKAPLRWKRAVIFAVIVGTIFFAIAWAPVALQEYDGWRERKAAEPHPIPASDAQQVAIMRAILAAENSPVRPPPPPPTPPPLPGSRVEPLPIPEMDPVDLLPVGLLDRTLSLRSCDPPRPSRAIRCDMGGHMGEEIETVERPSAFPLMWRRELVAASLVPVPLVDPGVDGIVLVAGRTDAIERLAGFSRAVMSPDGRAALVYFETHGRNFGAACIVYKLIHTSTGWKVDEQEWHCVG